MLKVGTRIKNLANVTLSNVVIFVGNIIVHFVLPLSMSVENYSYWQLHSLYVGYCAFALLGLNDGIHLLYSNLNYSEKNYSLFRSFRNVSYLLSLIGAFGVVIYALLFRNGMEQFVLFVIAIETPAACLNSVFNYIYQGTMRYKQYARGNRIEGISLVVIIFILYFAGIREVPVFIIGAATSKYIRLFYYFFSGKEIAFGHAGEFKKFLPIAFNTCRKGIVLMLSVTCNASFLLCTKLMLKNLMGVTEYGSYSFGLNILSAANVLVLAISQVFYPVLSRTSKDKYSELTNSLDRVVSYIGVVAMGGYFVASMIVVLIYSRYINILVYLHFLFPIFVFTCKNNLVIMNTFKVKKLQLTMLISNAMAVLFNGVFSFLAIYLFKSIQLAAVISLLTYILFYFGSKIWIKAKIDEGVKINYFDLIYIILFEVIAIACNSLHFNVYINNSIGLGCYFIVGSILLFIERKNIRQILNILMHE